MRYVVKAARGEVVTDLQVEAADAASARAVAAQSGYAVLTVHPRGIGRFTAPFLRRRFSVSFFTLELLSLLDAGLSLVEALQALESREKNVERRRLLEALLSSLRAGQPFSAAIAGFPQYFPPIYSAIVRASEHTGDLARALSRYVEYEQQFERVRNKVASALLYPAILVVAGALVMSFLIFYVVPRFARIYEDMSATLPLFSALLLSAGRWIEHHGWMTLALIAAIGILGTHAATRPAVRARIAQCLWSVPVVGEKLKLFQLARLYRTLGMLQRSGMPIIASINMVYPVLPARLQPFALDARRLIDEGRSISAAMASAGLSDAVADRMLAVGERSGRMGEMLERIADFYDEEVSRWLDRAMRLFEPLLMSVIGLAIGIVVVLMYMPVFELASSVR